MAYRRNIAIIGARRDDCRLGFFQAALLKDHAGILERLGPNTQHPGMSRLTDAARVTALAPTITACLYEAIGYAAAGITAPREPRMLDLPAELVDALDADPELAAAMVLGGRRLEDRIRTVRPRDTSTLDAAIHNGLKELLATHLEAWYRNYAGKGT